MLLLLAGFSGISGNFYPFAISALCPGSANDASLTEDMKEKLQAFLSLGEVAIVDQYPYSAKKYLAQYEGLPIGSHCRTKDFPAYNEVQLAHIAGLKGVMEVLCADAGIPVIEPSLSGPSVRTSSKL